MNVIEIQGYQAKLNLSLEDLLTITSALNELCHGIKMSDADIEIRVGASRSEISSLLKELINVVDRIEIADQEHDLLIEAPPEDRRVVRGSPSREILPHADQSRHALI